MRFAKHDFPYNETYYRERSKSVGELFNKNSQGQEGLLFRYLWTEWNGNVRAIPQILRQIFPDLSLQTTEYDSFTLLETFGSGPHNIPRLIIAYDNDPSMKYQDRKPISQILSTYALSAMLSNPHVLCQALLAIEGGSYLAGFVINQLHFGPEVEYAKYPLSIRPRSEQDFASLWNVLSYPGGVQSPFTSVLEESSKLRLWRCIGAGSTGTVYEASYPNSKERFAAKIIYVLDDEEILNIEDLKTETNIRSVKDIKLRSTLIDNIVTDLIMAPLGKIFRPNCYVPPEYQVELKKEHFRDILYELQTMHKSGFIFRDVSLKNFILDCASKKAKLVNLGSCCKENAAYVVKGCTSKSESCLFIPRDDLESLYKAYLIWKHPKEELEDMLTTAAARYPPFSKQCFEAIHMFWAPYIEPIEKMEYSELLTYLARIFTNN